MYDLEPDPDLHQSERPDPHPDPDENDADPQHWNSGNNNFRVGVISVQDLPYWTLKYQTGLCSIMFKNKACYTLEQGGATRYAII
jgi:hypothetical protein